MELNEKSNKGLYSESPTPEYAYHDCVS